MCNCCCCWHALPALCVVVHVAVCTHTSDALVLLLLLLLPAISAMLPMRTHYRYKAVLLAAKAANVSVDA